MPVLKTVFWDVDGTLADTEMDGHRPAFNRAFAEHGLKWTWDPETYRRLLSIPGGGLRMKTFAQILWNRPACENSRENLLESHF